MSLRDIRPENIHIKDDPARVRRVQGDLTLRDYFAAKAMAAIVGSEAWNVAAAEGSEIQPHHVATEAYAIADAMLRARTT